MMRWAAGNGPSFSLRGKDLPMHGWKCDRNRKPPATHCGGTRAPIARPRNLAFLVRIRFELHVNGNLRWNLSLKINWCPVFLSETDFLFLLNCLVGITFYCFLARVF